MAKNDFFLDSDDAQTLGDINYMRKSVKVRRTFPKTIKNKDGFEVVKEVSSMGERRTPNNGNLANGSAYRDYTPANLPQNPVAPTPVVKPETSISNNSFSQPTFASTDAKMEKTKSPEERRKMDTSMDMFRNMARSMRKR